MLHLDIDQLSAPGAERVVVPLGFPVETARAVAKTYLRDHPGVLQIAQRVIDGGKADRRKPSPGRVKNLVRRQMPLGFPDDLQHNLALLRQPCVFLAPALFVCVNHNQT